jgi:hypothetical protein
MTIKLHRHRVMFAKSSSHPCWKVQKALNEAGIEFEDGTMPARSPASPSTDHGRPPHGTPRKGDSMKRRFTIGLTALGLLPVVPLAATASAQSRSARQTNAITLRLRAHVEHVQYVDNAPAGRSAGDTLVFTERVMNPSGKRVGSDAASCVALFDQRWLCTGTYILPGGQIMVHIRSGKRADN